MQPSKAKTKDVDAKVSKLIMVVLGVRLREMNTGNLTSFIYTAILCANGMDMILCALEFDGISLKG